MSRSIPESLSSVKLALLVRKMRTEIDAGLLASEPIAVVGLGCRFPGACSPDAFWRLIEGHGDAITEVPSDRWDAASLYDAEFSAPGKMNTRWGGFLSQIDRFDARFFGIVPREAVSMDPQQRLLLEVAWEALEDAGQLPLALAGSRTGVFVGVYNDDYAQLQTADRDTIDAFTSSGTAHSIAAGRISFLLDFRGPSITVDTACSASLTAVHLACQSLRARECDMALAGGSSLVITPEQTISLSKWGVLAPDGRCKVFDARANGFVRGEGCGVIVLKRLAEALAAGDRVLGVIRGTAVNQDGRSNVLTAPNGLAQQDVIRRALENARIDAGDISYVETHGTGTALGDPIEVEALAEVLGRVERPSGRCGLGSVKANIGHLEAAAGIAGLIKVLLCLEHERIPAQVHFTSLNPHIDLDGTSLEIVANDRRWPSGSRPRCAGVSAFGFVGSNAHVIVEEAPATPAAIARPPIDPSRSVLVSVSGHTSEALRDQASSYAAFVDESAARPLLLTDVALTAGACRTAHEHRLCVVARSTKDLAQSLAAFVAGHADRNVVMGRAAGKQPPLVFVFSGQGSQWIGMGRGLLESEPIFRHSLERTDALFRSHVPWSIVDELRADADASRLNATEVAQPAIFAMQIALADLWQSWGMTPAAVIGHSIGEVAAAVVAGALTIEDAVRVVFHRSRLMQRAHGMGRMAAVELSIEEAEARVGGSTELAIAAHNGPRSVVVSGAREAVDAFVEPLAARGLFTRTLPVDYAFHSPQMDAFRDELIASLNGIRPVRTRVPFISTVTGAPIDGDALGPGYWANNTRMTVRFASAIRHASTSGAATFLEIGPHAVLVGSILQCLGADAAQSAAIGSLRRDHDELATVLLAAGALYVRGYAIDWRALNPAAQPVRLPPYAWQRERFWIDAPPRERRDGQTRTLPGDWYHRIDWQKAVALTAIGTSRSGGRGACVLFADTGGVAAQVSAQLEREGQRCIVVAHGRTYGEADGRFTIDPERPEHARRLVERILSDGVVIDRLMYLWPLDASVGALREDARTLDAAALVVGGALHVVQALCARSLTPPLHFISRGAQRLFDHEPAGAPLQGLVWGFSRSVALEYPGWSCTNFDLDPVANAGDCASRIVEDLRLDVRDDQVAYRGVERYRASIAPHPVAASDVAFSPEATYLISGGLGGLGLVLARWIVDRGARHVALVGRRPPSDAARAVIAALEANGASVTVAGADVSNRDDLANALDAVIATGRPIRGVFHAAGVLRRAPLADERWESVVDTLRAKVQGTWNLHQLTEGLPLDCFVLFSSLASMIGSPGQAAYAAANAFLDSFAHFRRASGLPALVVNWGPWAEVGMAASLGDDDKRRRVSEAIGEIAPALGVRALGNAMAMRETQLAIGPIDWPAFVRRFPAGEIPPFLADVASGPVPDASTRPPRYERFDRAAFAAASPARQRMLLHDFLERQAAAILGLTTGTRIDTNQPLQELGLVSLMAVEFRNALAAALDRPLPVTLLFDCPTLDVLAASLLARDDAAPRTRAADDSTIAPADLASLAALSASDAEALLAAELDQIALEKPNGSL